MESGPNNNTLVYSSATQPLLPPPPVSRVEAFLPGLPWILKTAISVHSAVMLIAGGGLETERSGAMSPFVRFSEKQRSRQRLAMMDLSLCLAGLAYRSILGCAFQHKYSTLSSAHSQVVFVCSWLLDKQTQYVHTLQSSTLIAMF